MKRSGMRRSGMRRSGMRRRRRRRRRTRRRTRRRRRSRRRRRNAKDSLDLRKAITHVWRPYANRYPMITMMKLTNDRGEEEVEMPGEP